MKRLSKTLALVSFAGLATTVSLAGCGDQNSDAGKTDDAARMSGGGTTVFDQSSHAFTLPAPGLTAEEDELHLEGDAAFEAQFVTAPAEVNPGLGPVFNNNSCNSCHIRNGRGMPRLSAGALRSQLLIRVSLADGEVDPTAGNAPVPGLGFQIQDHAVYGEEPDAYTSLEWEEIPGEYADGTPYSLRKPVVSVELPDGSSLPDNVLTSLRQPPPIFGLGLLEEVPEETLLALADPDDADGDGISGRPNYVWSVREQQAVIGRFGLKANQPDLEQQSAAAYHDDMGVTNPVFPGENGTTEIDQNTLDASTFYSQSLGVPARRRIDDPLVLQGEKLFEQVGCADCHTPTLETGDSDIEVLANQTFHAYTDLLLHDMGEGLADKRPDFEADGYEWRTPPLWGVGLTQTVLPGSGYLHDGRARTLEEAILWHGGEAEAARNQFRDELDASEREALVAFLQSL
ncbi:c-type cytochrome [Persicimonas caeni]|uniref:C-type cytochrome n=1 Tax=Persicimonas caeni TaxID=2292766 RepID=A0A4Y6PT83_PERCE|nr:di-heme oxidoredictase family protein [Persicimonas caeni]QDG51544.1 c-type cytochrome [Persicimonas caeni]QED32765.1 c-type cytochrome [Persicimonas caeni]